LRVNGVPVQARVQHAEITLAEGAGNMQVARIVSDFQAAMEEQGLAPEGYKDYVEFLRMTLTLRLGPDRKPLATAF